MAPPCRAHVARASLPRLHRRGLIAGLLLSGRFVGEELIVARRLRLAPDRRARRLTTRWRPGVEPPLASLLARSPRSERGPPAALAPAA